MIEQTYARMSTVTATVLLVVAVAVSACNVRWTVPEPTLVYRVTSFGAAAKGSPANAGALGTTEDICESQIDGVRPEGDR